jgi:hypothetical protein
MRLMGEGFDEVDEVYKIDNQYFTNLINPINLIG